MAFAFHDDRVMLSGGWSKRRLGIMGLVIVALGMVGVFVGVWAQHHAQGIDGIHLTSMDYVATAANPIATRSVVTGLAAAVWAMAALTLLVWVLVRSINQFANGGVPKHLTERLPRQPIRGRWTWLSLGLGWLVGGMLLLMSIDIAVGCAWDRSMGLELIRGFVGLVVLLILVGVLGLRGGYEWVVRRETLFFIWLASAVFLVGGVSLADAWTRSFTEQPPYIFQDWFAIVATVATIWVGLTWSTWRSSFHRAVIVGWAMVLLLYYASTLGAWLYQPRMDKTIWAWSVLAFLELGSLLTAAVMYRWTQDKWLRTASVTWPLFMAYGWVNNYAAASMWELTGLALLLLVILFATLPPVKRW